MYSLTLEINQICNLNCQYCYLGEQSGERMELSTAKKSISFAVRQAQNHKDKKLRIDFIGGEALLDFEFMEQAVSYALEMSTKEKVAVQFTTTTNATILTEKIMNFLEHYNFLIKISIDGSKKINDRNRVSLAGYSVHDKIKENLGLIKDYEKRTGNTIQVTNVITRNNYQSYFDSLQYLTQELGFKVIDTAIDYSIDWKFQEFTCLSKQIKKSLEWFYQLESSKKLFYWSMIDEIKNSAIKKKKFYCCGGGIICSYIRTNGDIYSCPAYLDKKVVLGNINKGWITEKIQFLRSVDHIDNKKCAECDMNEFCGAKGCFMTSIMSNDDFNIPNQMLCWMQQFKFELYRTMVNGGKSHG